MTLYIAASHITMAIVIVNIALFTVYIAST